MDNNYWLLYHNILSSFTEAFLGLLLVKLTFTQEIPYRRNQKFFCISDGLYAIGLMRDFPPAYTLPSIQNEKY